MSSGKRALAVVETPKPQARKPRRVFKRRNGVTLMPSDPVKRYEACIEVRTTEEDADVASKLAEASISVDPGLQAAHSLRAIQGQKSDAGPGLNELAYELEKRCETVRGGDMSGVEDMLLTQSHTLDALFGAMTRRACLNMAEYPEAFERYMRIALKAQSQCRATLESLALVKNPPNVMFAKQANFAAGPQQVNNGSQHSTPAHAEEKQISANKLLEGVASGERLDPAATIATGRTNQELATVGAFHRAED